MTRSSGSTTPPQGGDPLHEAEQASARPSARRTPARGSDGRTEPRAITQWAVTAAACATVICLTGWPRPTLYALALVACAALILAALRAAAGHRSGPDPDRPDTQSAQASDPNIPAAPDTCRIVRTESGPVRACRKHTA